MEWHINDLSLDGQFETHTAFCDEALRPLIELRRRNGNLRERLFCSRQLYERPVTGGGMSLRESVQQLGDREFCALVLAWITKYGPFWDDSRAEVADDYFEFEGLDVTDQGLGECARRQIIQINARSFSFLGGQQDWARSPLIVQQGLPEEPLGQIEVPNDCSMADLDAAALALTPLPRSWREVIDQAGMQYTGLVISDEIVTVLQPQPFSAYIGQRVIVLLGVLQTIVDSLDAEQKFTNQTREITRNHFSGQRALFSNESSTNKRKFKDALTFQDPLDPKKRIFCPWHGKISSRAFRIHFDWPLSSQNEFIKVVYIGPKITKR